MATNYVTVILASQTLAQMHARRAMPWTTRPTHAKSGGKCAAWAPSMATRALPPRKEQNEVELRAYLAHLDPHVGAYQQRAEALGQACSQLSKSSPARPAGA